MIAISEQLIRSARGYSQEDEALQPVEKLLSSSPPLLALQTAPTAAAPEEDTVLQPAPTGRHQTAARRREPERKANEPMSFKREQVSKRPANARSAFSGMMEKRPHVRGGSMRQQLLKVFIKPNSTPLVAKIQGACTVERVIELILRQHNEASETKLNPHAGQYDLRILDDEETGIPDTDFPPLERSRDIRQCGVDAVALVVRPAPGGGETRRKKRGVSLDLNKRGGELKFMKIHMPNHEAHMLRVSRDWTLKELLPVIAKKRSCRPEDMQPHQYKFCYTEDQKALPMDMLLKDVFLATDELRLQPRMKAAFAQLDEPHEAGAVDLSLQPTFYSTLSEYIVRKTNRRGKVQERILGIDKDGLHNKIPRDQLRKSTSERVHRPFRPIAEVTAVEKHGKYNFRVVFGGAHRDYQAQTSVECDEIVGKLRYLVNQRKQH